MIEYNDALHGAHGCHPIDAMEAEELTEEQARKLLEHLGYEPPAPKPPLQSGAALETAAGLCRMHCECPQIFAVLAYVVTHGREGLRDMSRKLGVPRTTLHRRIEKIRAEYPGMGRYFPQFPSKSHRRGKKRNKAQSLYRGNDAPANQRSIE